jgi:uncharacterized protein YecT (DUF1311 family)
MAKYNKEKFKKEMKELSINLNRQYETLMDTIVTDPKQLEKFGEMYSGGFHDYTFRNMVIAWIQFRDVSLLAGRKTWNKKGRWIQKRQKAIRIYAPNTRKIKTINERTGEEEEEFIVSNFRLIPVFDVAQTGVPKIITLLGRSFPIVDPTDDTGLVVGAENYITSDKPYKFEKFAKDSPLPIKVIKNYGKGGTINKEQTKISKRENELSMINTLYHEEAHFFLDHIGNKKISREIKEVTAEAAAYLVSSYFGIKNEKAKYYIGGWEGNKELMQGVGRYVMHAAEEIIKLHKKELIEDKKFFVAKYSKPEYQESKYWCGPG